MLIDTRLYTEQLRLESCFFCGISWVKSRLRGERLGAPGLACTCLDELSSPQIAALMVTHRLVSQI